MGLASAAKTWPGGAAEYQKIRAEGPVEQHSFRVSVDNHRLQRHRRVWAERRADR